MMQIWKMDDTFEVRTPVFYAEVEDGDVSLQWKISKIPEYIFLQGDMVCRHIQNQFDTEICLELFYHTRKKQYFWYIPKQICTATSAETMAEELLELPVHDMIKVGQFHSHGSIRPFFSEVDNEDENCPGLYGVWGNYPGESKMRLRMVLRRHCYMNLDIRNLICDGQKPGGLNRISEELRNFAVTQHQAVGSILSEQEYPVISNGSLHGLFVEDAEPYLLYFLEECELFQGESWKMDRTEGILLTIYPFVEVEEGVPIGITMTLSDFYLSEKEYEACL